MFSKYIFSQVSSEFVSPLFPRSGEDVEIKLYVSDKISISNISIFTNEFGLEILHVMDKAGCYYKKRVKQPYKGDDLRYYFSFLYQERYYYYSKRGFTTYVPPAKDHFRLISDYHELEYISKACCYQIFPDRFFNGDEDNDVKDGAYTFDNGVVNTHTFDEKPEEYEKSRCLDFYNGDLKGIELKLDYIKESGFDVIYINPIMQSKTVHRFDCIDFFNVDDKLGGNEALISLVNKAHSMGIKIIIDISINHTGSDHNWFIKAKENSSSKEAQYYYKDGDDFIYWQNVKTLPQLNYNSQELRDIIYRKAGSAMQKFLLPPYNIDGWRLDVAPEVGRTSKDQLCKEVWREVRSSLIKVKEDLYLVGEDWNDASEYLSNDMWDATMNYYGSGRILRLWFGERDRFLLSGWGHSPVSEKKSFTSYEMKEAFELSESPLVDQAKFFRMNLIDSHDTPRLHNNRELYDEDIYSGIIMALYLLPGMPNIYYGDEISLDGELGSVEKSRYPMEWNKEKWNHNMLRLHKKLSSLRSFDDLNYASTYYIPINDDCILILRKAKKAYGLFLNKALDYKTISLELEQLKEYTNAYDFFSSAAYLKENDKFSIKIESKKSKIIIFE